MIDRTSRRAAGRQGRGAGALVAAARAGGPALALLLATVAGTAGGCQPSEPELGTVSAVPGGGTSTVALAGSGIAGGAPVTAAAGPPVPAVPCGDAAFGAASAAGAPAAPPSPAAAASPAASGAPPAAPSPSIEKKTADNYVLEYVPAREAALGKPAATCVRITPAAGWKVNLAYPFQVDVTSPAGVDSRAKLRKEDAEAYDEHGTRVSLPFVAHAAGDLAFAAVIHFGVCNASVCDTPVEELAWTTAAK
ncbi:MAG TPA: hypothetical protein VG389_10290 [Myxococcota bacterium]|jgi:hypothetical protein|nr:hypothetical protein [Myxococcota bacterium]